MKNNHKYDWANKQNFIKDLATSQSMSDFLMQRGLSASSGNFYTFKKWVYVHGIDIKNFNFKKSIKKHKVKLIKKVSLDDIFCENSIVSKQQLRKRVKKENLIEYKCQCGVKGMWQGNPITLQLEHKNGNNSDNRLSNLEYLCPNCHSQTQTYGSKNHHIKTFNKRLLILKKFININNDNLAEIAQEMFMENQTLYTWLKKYKNKLEENNIFINFSKSFVVTKLQNIPEILAEVEATDLSKNSLLSIAQKYNVGFSAVRQFIKKHDLNLYLKLDNKEGLDNNEFSRLQQLSPITNKKQVPTLAKSWNTSINGAKKWIKNNAPDKFAEIYDDALLEKNKVAALKARKLDYIKNLTIDNFDLNDFIKDYGGNKSGAYSLLSKYNKDLFIHISKTPDCIHCNGKTRAYGTTVKSGETIPRYRCLDCDKSFT